MIMIIGSTPWQVLSIAVIVLGFCYCCKECKESVFTK